MLLGAQRGSNGTTVGTGTRASLSIAKLNVYDEAIASADINCLFNEDGAADGLLSSIHRLDCGISCGRQSEPDE